MGAIASSLRLLQAGFTLAGPARAFRNRRADAGEKLGRALERLGPAYIKLGQMLATRPDIVGVEMAQALEHLQDRLPPFSEKEAPSLPARLLVTRLSPRSIRTSVTPLLSVERPDMASK